MDNLNRFDIGRGSCTNHSINSFNSTIHPNNNELLVLNFNMQSFNAKIDELCEFLDQINVIPKIMVLTETWFAIDRTSTIDGFKDFHCTRPGTQEHGGVSIYILDSIPAKCTLVSKISSPELSLFVA